MLAKLAVAAGVEPRKMEDRFGPHRGASSGAARASSHQSHEGLRSLLRDPSNITGCTLCSRGAGLRSPRYDLSGQPSWVLL